jgi:excisionase family DNA binding protein
MILSEDDRTKLPSMLKITEAARLLNCTRQHLYHLARRQLIPFVMVGKTIRIPRDKLLEVLPQNREGR